MTTFMKMTASAILALTLTGLTKTYAQTVETSREINAQTTITRASIDNVITRINTNRPNTNFKASDYWGQVQNFKNTVDSTLKSYEDSMQKDLFPKVAFWLEQYNSIAKSSDFSNEQKAMLLKQRYDNLINQMASLSSDYQKAVKKVYDIVPNNKLTVTQTFSRPGEKIKDTDSFERTVTITHTINGIYTTTPVGFIVKTRKSENRTWGALYFYKVGSTAPFYAENFQNFRYGIDIRLSGDYKKATISWDYKTVFENRRESSNPNLDGFNFIRVFPEAYLGYEKEVFQNLIYPDFKGQCRSIICLGLRAGDLSGLLTQVKLLIDRDITFTLADGKTVELKSVNQDITDALKYLAFVDYPETLPFDI